MRMYMLIAILYAIISVPAPYAQDKAPVSSPSVGEFLTPDGRFDLEAARKAGFQGSLNMNGFASGIDEAGRPVFRAAANVAATAGNPDDVYWDNNLSSSTEGNGYIHALTVYDGKLIAGGEFVIAGGVLVNHIAAWDGTSWAPLGAGLDGSVNTLVVYDGKLIAGGSFTSSLAKPLASGHISEWNGSSWLPLGEGINGADVATLTVYDGKLIAGGNFSAAGGISANHIAAWDGSSWSPLGGGMSNKDNDYSYVYALLEYKGKLIAGGRFISADNISANYIAFWDGSSWSPLGSGCNGFVTAFTVFDGKLIAGGYFTTAGNISVKLIAAWDGLTWSSLGSGIGGTSVNALAVYGGKLIAGGYFDTAGIMSVGHIASWNGNSWSSLGSGVHYGVKTLTVYDDKLIAGGLFTIAGGKIAPYIATWFPNGPLNVSEPSALPSALRLSPAFPNPFNPSTTIEFSVPADSRVVVKIYTITGQEVVTLHDKFMPAGRHSVAWEAKGMPSGVYICSVKAGAFTETRKMTLLK